MTAGLLVNLFGGPGVGKSTMALGSSFCLKLLQINSELVTEVAKDLTWEGRTRPLMEWQSYVTSKQHRNIDRVLNQVDVVITDSPILTGCFYKPEGYSDTFDKFWLERHGEMVTLNYHIVRDSKRPYDPTGRRQTEDEAIQVDNDIEDWLKAYGVEHTVLEGSISNIATILVDIADRLDRDVTAFPVQKLVDSFSILLESVNDKFYL